jgi:hypothetical protein
VCSHPLAAWRKKGFQVTVEQNEAKFLALLDPKTVHVAVIISSAVRSSAARPDFAERVHAFHKAGGGLFIFGDNDPFFEHANVYLRANFGFKLQGDYHAAQKLAFAGVDDCSKYPPPKGQFSEHMIFTGIETLYEGITICHPDVRHCSHSTAQHSTVCECTSVAVVLMCCVRCVVCVQRVPSDWKVIGSSTDGKPNVIVREAPPNRMDGSSTDGGVGRIALDMGFTKLYCSWDDAGSARYVTCTHTHAH